MIRYLIADPIGGLLQILYMLPGLVIGFTLHEWAHAYASVKMGDDGPRQAGRLTLNPLRQIDWAGFGLFLIFGFGWAKSVQTNALFYKNRKSGKVIVSLAGIAANLALCLLFALLSKFSPWMVLTRILAAGVNVNAMLFVLNLLPIPPLDGSKVLRALAPLSAPVWMQLDRYGFLLLFILSLTGILGTVLGVAGSVITGLSFGIWSFI